MSERPIRHAATLIVVRDAATAPRVLMGQRGAKAAFMPSKFVFPGGAVDAADADVTLAEGIDAQSHARLLDEADAVPGAPSPEALAVAAIRELHEETGLTLGTPGEWPDAPAGWERFAERGLRPSAAGLSFVFRAITPPGRPRRFDARFFTVDAAQLCGDPDDFSDAEDELSHLQWLPLDEVRKLDLPFITEVVLAEVAGRLPNLDAPESVPFFDNRAEESLFHRLGGAGPLTGRPLSDFKE